MQVQNKSFSDRRIRAGRREPTGDDGIVGPLRGPVSVLGPEFIPGLHILVGVTAALSSLGVMGEFLESIVTVADDRQQAVKTSSHHPVITSKYRRVTGHRLS